MGENEITSDYLREHPDHIFVFGDNRLRQGHGGAAALRDHPNTYGFITKKLPNNEDSSFYTVEEYLPVLLAELWNLNRFIELNPDKTFLISKLGSGLANKYGIWEKLICKRLKSRFSGLPNVRFLW